MSIAVDIALEALRDGELALPEPPRSSKRNSIDYTVKTSAVMEPFAVIEESVRNTARKIAKLPRHRTKPRRSRSAPKRGFTKVAPATTVQDGTNRVAIVTSDNAILLNLNTEC